MKALAAHALLRAWVGAVAVLEVLGFFTVHGNVDRFEEYNLSA
jgi:hypothetical protein